MSRFIARAALGALFVVVACRGRSEPSAMGGMSVEEHARMLARDQGAVTTSGDRVAVHLTAAQAQAIGVTYTTAARGPLVRPVRTVGQITPAEPNLADVTARIDGYVERLHVDATGAAVRRGQPLLELYSPMLVAAQEELLTAKRLAGSLDSSDSEALQRAQELLAAARRRLVYWDISAAQVERIERTGEITKTLTLEAPISGVVLEKMVVAGQAVMPGMRLYRLADLSTVWVEGEVFEQDLAFVRVGTPIEAQIDALPGRRFRGRVEFVWPTVSPETRTARVRLALPNRGGALRPGMYATVRLEAMIAAQALTLPTEAVVMTGERNLVFLVTSEGGLEPREVELGSSAGGRVQILGGLEAGQRVVASANFLVDAESRLSSGAGMPAMPGMKMDSGRPRP